MKYSFHTGDLEQVPLIVAYSNIQNNPLSLETALPHRGNFPSSAPSLIK